MLKNGSKSLMVRIVAGACALLIAGSVLLTAFYF